MSGVLHSNESQGDSPNKIGLVGSARCDGGGAFVFYRYFSCSFVSARGLRLSGAGGDVGVGYAVLIFEWLTRVARKRHQAIWVFFAAFGVRFGRKPKKKLSPYLATHAGHDFFDFHFY